MENQNEELQKKVEKLELEVDEMKKQLEYLLSKETKLENNQGIQKEAKVEHKQVNQNETTVKQNKPVQKAVKPVVPKEKIDIEALIFQKWLPRFFIFIFIIGIMWGFKAASEYGVLNKYAKVGIGFVFAILLTWYGQRQIKEKRITLGQALLGGVLPVLFLTTFAMHHLYQMIGSSVAFSLQVVWVGIGFYFMNKYKSEAIGLISVLGAILIPFLIKSNEPNYLFFTLYETSIYLLFTFYAAFRKYKYLYTSSAVLLNLVYLIAGIDSFKGLEYFASSIIVQHIGLLTILLSSQFSMKKQILMLHTSFVLTIGWIFGGYEEQTRTIILIILCVSYLFLSIYYKKQSEFFFAFSTNFLLAFSFLCLDNVNDNLLNTVLIIQALLTYLFYLRYKDLFKLIIASITIIPVGFKIVTVPFTSIVSFASMDWFVLIIAIITISILAYKHEKEKEKQLILISCSLLIVLLIITYITQVVQIMMLNFSDNVIRLSINISWIVIAIVAMVLGSMKKFKVWTYIGIGLLLITLCKLVLIDLPNITLLVRAGLFILLGLIGLIISRIFFKGKS